LKLEDFHSVTTRPLLNQLNKILVQCKWCSQINIQRGDYKDHVKTCTKIFVSCPAVAINCNWTGKYDQMQGHVNAGLLVKIQPTIVELKTIAQQQSEQIHFLYTILETISDGHDEACQEKYKNDGTGYCNICQEAVTFDEYKRY
jgi:hypothetical protein